MMAAMGLGKMLMLCGAVLFLVGLVVMLGGRFGLGNLPGDIGWRKGNTAVYFPIASSIILSLVLTIVLNVVLRFLR
ncbi:MAG: DUF2905 domain-containing protein [Abitibacteriaceae bacterium]|nr:DUF2905 domain-containing protein [Abditibacteriaceae bacterium]MBV9868476.1 DUF2905 domain-containing protein [Abditibacteriaceae bacterium]